MGGVEKDMMKALKIACLVLAVASIWFSLSFRGSKVFFKMGTWEHSVQVSEASSGGSGGSDSGGETDFA